MVIIVKYIDCRVPGTRLWEGPTWRYMERDDLQNNQYPECKERWEREMWDVSRGKRMTR